MWFNLKPHLLPIPRWIEAYLAISCIVAFVGAKLFMFSTEDEILDRSQVEKRSGFTSWSRPPCFYGTKVWGTIQRHYSDSLLYHSIHHMLSFRHKTRLCFNDQFDVAFSKTYLLPVWACRLPTRDVKIPRKSCPGISGRNLRKSRDFPGFRDFSVLLIFRYINNYFSIIILYF